MIYLISEAESIKRFWLEEFSTRYGVNIVDDKDDWYKQEKINETDILILDVDMFDKVHQILEYKESLPSQLNIIAILEEPKLAHGAFLIKKGFKSYLGKKTSKIIIDQAIKTVLQGNVWVYPELMSYIIKMIVDNNEPNNYEVLEKLSPKEQEVAKFVAKGYSNKEIAKEMDVQLITVKKHLGSIFEKLHIRDRVSLAILLNKK
jgi:DNA-binding NarL/FixJ family response regulator